MQPTTSTVLTVSQAATETGITKRRIRHALRTGNLAGTKTGAGTSAWVIERDELYRWANTPSA